MCVWQQEDLDGEELDAPMEVGSSRAGKVRRGLEDDAEDLDGECVINQRNRQTDG